jgi:Domain of unknown function (DUF5602)
MQSKVLVALAVAGLAVVVSNRSSALGETSSSVRRDYGAAVELGRGRARTYIVVDPSSGNPVEVGVALDEAALEGLPATGNLGGGGHEHYNSYLLGLPAQNGTPYQFVELNWNPKGHGGPYTAPHFDFHFYRISRAEREAIDPAIPGYAARAANLPEPDQIPAGYMAHHQLLSITPEQAAVPKMGLHWIDVSSPELPPRNQPFTATFIVGSWDGKVIFDEPMVTRDFILAQRDTAAAHDQVIPVPASKRYSPAGFYMNGYRVSYDAQAKEFRIALTGLRQRV